LEALNKILFNASKVGKYYLMLPEKVNDALVHEREQFQSLCSACRTIEREHQIVDMII
jgi:hypothetical protein